MKLFPERLDRGSKGPAVFILQLVLKALKLNYNIVPDGNYGKETALAVKRFQDRQGWNNLELRGSFGPATKAALQRETGIDVDAIEDHWFHQVPLVPDLEAPTKGTSSPLAHTLGK